MHQLWVTQDGREHIALLERKLMQRVYYKIGWGAGKDKIEERLPFQPIKNQKILTNFRWRLYNIS